MFSDNTDYLQLISRARLGDKKSLGLLSEKVRAELCTYIYRLTFDPDLTEDIMQETLLEMVRSIKSLRKINCFKPWLFRIASTKIKKHFRLCGNKRIQKKTVFDVDRLLGYSAGLPGVQESLLKKEISQTIVKAMGDLKLRYRNVLILRCFEQMSYPDIACAMDCSSIQAQLLFFRAKQSLKKQLLNSGYNKEYFLTSLGLFAALTAAPYKTASASTASASITSAAPALFQAGTVGAVAGALTSKTAIVVAGLLVATAIVVTPVVNTLQGEKGFHIVTANEFDESQFQYPAMVNRCFNHTPYGWKGTSSGSHNPQLISLTRWLTGPPQTENSAVLLPEGAWVELQFASDITDGPGNDIIIVEKCKNGERADIFITDCKSEELYLGSIQVPEKVSHEPTIFGCDISDYDLSFIPCGVRILTTNPGGYEDRGSEPGFDLVSVRARFPE